MMLKPMAAAALLAAAVSSAFAQTTAPPPASQPAPPLAAESIQGVGNFLTRQEPGQWRVEDLEEMSVYTPDGKGIGKIEDVLFDQNGRLTAYIIEVGGFLGVNEKRIAVAPGAVEFRQAPGNRAGREGVRVVMRLGRAELEQAPAFRSIDDR